MQIAPLNGTKTHPLTPHAIEKLRAIARAPMPRQSLNAGVANRLEREALVEEVQLPSLFMIHRGGTCLHLKITDAGRAVLASLKP